MKLALLQADLDELARIGATVDEALDRGLRAVSAPPSAGSRVEDLAHRCAEAYAQMRLLHHGFATRARTYEGSASRYHTVEDALHEARRIVVPALRSRLGRVRAREEALRRCQSAAGELGPSTGQAGGEPLLGERSLFLSETRLDQRQVRETAAIQRLQLIQEGNWIRTTPREAQLDSTDRAGRAPARRPLVLVAFTLQIESQ